MCFPSFVKLRIRGSDTKQIEKQRKQLTVKNKQANDRKQTYLKTHICINIMTQRVDLVLDLRTNKGTHTQ